ncbi:MAG: cytidine/deoxycytidylate deaminase family protein [Actinomycetota bacterium]
MEPFKREDVDTSGRHADLRRTRPSWDEYFMSIAHEVATRSTCPRLAVGAVIVRDRRILTTGYNGSPSGMPHCDEVGCLIRVVDGRESCQRTLHAEQNAIIQAAYHGVSVDGATIYSTHQPCLMCVKMIMNAGIEEVRYAGGYPDPLAMELAAEGGLKMVRFTPGEQVQEP